MWAPDGLWTCASTGTSALRQRRMLARFPDLPFSRSRPQGGGTAPIDQRAVFTAIVYVLISGCAWRYLSACRAQT